MTEASRKRSRKSKIVLRDCALDEEDDIELQLRPKSKKVIKRENVKKPAPKLTKINEAPNKSVLNKLKAPIENIEETAPRFDINVEIEVEKCEEDHLNTSDEYHDEQTTSQITDIPISSKKKIIKKDIKPILKQETNLLVERSSIVTDGIYKTKTNKDIKPIILARKNLLDTHKIVEPSSNSTDVMKKIEVDQNIKPICLPRESFLEGSNKQADIPTNTTNRKTDQETKLNCLHETLLEESNRIAEILTTTTTNNTDGINKRKTYQRKKPSCLLRETLVEESNKKIEISSKDDRSTGHKEVLEYSNKNKSKQDVVKPIIMSREKILEESNNIAKTSSNIADGILDICLRNTLGTLKEEHANTMYEKEIQEALNAWQRWQLTSFHRENPLFYKCYICSKSWWNLSEFRDHISMHTDLKVDIERYSQNECNIIAFEPNSRPEDIKDFYTEDLCYRCGKDYTKHEISARDANNHYMNIGCSKWFTTCTELKDHAFACKVCRIENNCYYCDICTLSFGETDVLNDHMILMHTVRSDRPIAANHSKCTECNEVYSSNMYHTCGPKEPDSICPYCFKHFSNKSLILDHINRSSQTWNCKICNEDIKWSCKKYEHLLIHTNLYTFVKMCVKCNGINVFVDDKNIEKHIKKIHKYKHSDFDRYFPKILVPISCIDFNQEESETQTELESMQEKNLEEKSIHEKNQEDKSMQENNREEKLIQEKNREEKSILEDKSIPENNREEKSIQEHQQTENNKSLLKESKQKPRLLISNPESVLHRVAILKRVSIDKQQKSVLKPLESILKSPEPLSELSENNIDSKENVLVPDFNEQKSISEEQENTIDNVTDEIIIKEESQDSDLSSELVIKEEPVDYDDYDDYTIQDNTNTETRIKQENEDSEYEEDIIKLNINIEDLLAKQTSRVFACQTDFSESITDNSIPEIDIKKESILEPEVIISNDEKKAFRCSKCPYQGKRDSYIKHVTITCPYAGVNSKKYVCSKTGLQYKTIKKYLQHFVLHGNNPLFCPDCSKPFYAYGKLGSHVLTHVKQNFIRIKKISHRKTMNLRLEYQCVKCEDMIDVEDFFPHWENHTFEVKTQQVEALSAPRLVTDISEGAVQDCIKWMQGSPKDCVYCKRKFQRVNECKRHIIEHLLTDAYAQKQILGVLKCQVCHAGYSTPEKYKQHMRNHASLPVYKCEICDKTFSDSSNFTKHKKVHNLKVTVCDLCGKKFQSKSTLARHIEQHRASTPVPCDKCDKIFYFQSAYRRHFKSNHEKVISGYPCVICNTRFRSLKLKWDHMWEAHKERKHKADCPICFKSFRKYSDVRAHAKTDHNKDVSVFCVKNATKSVGDIQSYLNNSDIKIGRAETLVVYDEELEVD